MATTCFIVFSLAATSSVASGEGLLIVPHARNKADTSAAAGGPGTVHHFSADKHTRYMHGICGDAPGGEQTHNRAGSVVATYTPGSTVAFKVVITEHHAGFFEFELCLSANQLSESCFMQHRLLRDGCSCECPSDPTNSCSACDKCRRWWKPLTIGEQVNNSMVTSGYAGPNLTGPDKLHSYEYTMRYVIPDGIEAHHGVLRWHYMTTTSCTSGKSSPTEFWNCADVSIADGVVSDEEEIDNDALKAMQAENLIPLIEAGALQGVYSTCPKDLSGKLMGIGSQSDYEGLCGQLVDGDYENCKNLGSAAVVSQPTPPATQEFLEEEVEDPLEGLCGNCTGCIWIDGDCISEVSEGYCRQWQASVWCGPGRSGSLAQRRTVQRVTLAEQAQQLPSLEKTRRRKFLGPVLLQGRALLRRNASAEVQMTEL